MRLLILMGGKGTRLFPLTEYHPKVMSSIHGKPFLYYLLDLYKKHDIVLSVCHMKESIKEWCKQENIWPEYVEEPDFMGHCGAILYARPFLEGHKVFAVVNGDTYHNIDIDTLEKDFLNNSEYIAEQVFATNKLTKKPDCCGIYLFKQECFQYFRKGVHTDDVLKCIPTSKVYLSDKWYLDIGTHAGLRMAKRPKFLKVIDDISGKSTT